MYLITCLRELFMRIMKKLFCKETKELVNVEQRLVKVDKSKFSMQQWEVIKKCVIKGLDIDKIAKPKYSEKQMLLLAYGEILGVDTDSYANYCLSPVEMEYNLYLLCIDKYLGKDYLKDLLERTHLTVADTKIRMRLTKELFTKFQEQFEELACSKELKESTNEDRDKLAYYEYLKSKLVNRGIDFSSLEIDSIKNMQDKYIRICKSTIASLDDVLESNIDAFDITTASIIRQVVTVGEELRLQREEPVIVNKHGETIATFYPIKLSKDCVYLLGEGMYPLKILY